MLTATSPVQLYVTDGLIEEENAVCPNATVNFYCSTWGSTTIAWSSDAYIGPAGSHGTSQLQFNIESDVKHTKRDEYNSDTVATLINKSVDHDQLKLESTLEIRATLNSSVTCHHSSEGTSRTINITVLSEGKQMQLTYNVMCTRLYYILGHSPGSAWQTEPYHVIVAFRAVVDSEVKLFVVRMVSSRAIVLYACDKSSH